MLPRPTGKASLHTSSINRWSVFRNWCGLCSPKTCNGFCCTCQVSQCGVEETRNGMLVECQHLAEQQRLSSTPTRASEGLYTPPWSLLKLRLCLRHLVQLLADAKLRVAPFSAFGFPAFSPAASGKLLLPQTVSAKHFLLKLWGTGDGSKPKRFRAYARRRCEPETQRTQLFAAEGSETIGRIA